MRGPEASCPDLNFSPHVSSVALHGDVPKPAVQDRQRQQFRQSHFVREQESLFCALCHRIARHDPRQSKLLMSRGHVLANATGALAGFRGRRNQMYPRRACLGPCAWKGVTLRNQWVSDLQPQAFTTYPKSLQLGSGMNESHDGAG